MAYEMKIEHPNLGEDSETDIPGLGTFKNNGIYIIDNEQAAAFRVFHTTYTTDWEEDEEGNRTGRQTQIETRGPTLLEASEHMFGVTITTTDKKEEAPKKEPPAPPKTTEKKEGEE